MSKTPQSDALETNRKIFGFARSAPYGDCLKLCRKLEEENIFLKEKLGYNKSGSWSTEKEQELAECYGKAWPTMRTHLIKLQEVLDKSNNAPS